MVLYYWRLRERDKFDAIENAIVNSVKPNESIVNRIFFLIGLLKNQDPSLQTRDFKLVVENGTLSPSFFPTGELCFKDQNGISSLCLDGKEICVVAEGLATQENPLTFVLLPEGKKFFEFFSNKRFLLISRSRLSMLLHLWLYTR